MPHLKTIVFPALTDITKNTAYWAQAPDHHGKQMLYLLGCNSPDTAKQIKEFFLQKAKYHGIGLQSYHTEIAYRNSTLVASKAFLTQLCGTSIETKKPVWINQKDCETRAADIHVLYQQWNRIHRNLSTSTSSMEQGTASFEDSDDDMEEEFFEGAENDIGLAPSELPTNIADKHQQPMQSNKTISTSIMAMFNHFSAENAKLVNQKLENMLWEVADKKPSQQADPDTEQWIQSVLSPKF